MIIGAETYAEELIKVKRNVVEKYVDVIYNDRQGENIYCLQILGKILYGSAIVLLMYQSAQVWFPLDVENHFVLAQDGPERHASCLAGFRFC